jgi:phosphoglycolate phosphatase-like HAD superfamily hydrolase
VLRHIRLLILDLDYLVFNCAFLKEQALRQSLIALADQIPASVQLPEAAEAEAGFREHGFRWIRHLEIGLDEHSLGDLQQAYTLHENRLVESGKGGLYPGIEEFIMNSHRAGIAIALGAEATRDYMISVIDRHQMDDLFQVTLCAEEFGMGDADEMIVEIMRQVEVNPSETLVLGTCPHTFRAAQGLDILAVGCGWGIQQPAGLSAADLQSLTFPDLSATIEKADNLALQKSD